jgi:hypothetical protein
MTTRRLSTSRGAERCGNSGPRRDGHPHRVAGVFEFLQTGLVPRFAVSGLKCSIGVLGVLTLFTGLVLEMITRTRQELKRLIYLSLSKAAPRG